jgi:hypothetical protein
MQSSSMDRRRDVRLNVRVRESKHIGTATRAFLLLKVAESKGVAQDSAGEGMLNEEKRQTDHEPLLDAGKSR